MESENFLCCVYTHGEAVKSAKYDVRIQTLSLYGAANTASIDAVFEHGAWLKTFRCPIILKADFILKSYFYLLAFSPLQVPGYL